MTAMNYVTDQRELTHVVQVREEYVVEVGRDFKVAPDPARMHSTGVISSAHDWPTKEVVMDSAGGFASYDQAIEKGYELLDSNPGADWFRVNKMYVRIRGGE